MTSPTLSVQIRNIQSRLTATNRLLQNTLALATTIGLAPFRITGIQYAIDNNQAAWAELNAVATALEITQKPVPYSHRPSLTPKGP